MNSATKEANDNSIKTIQVRVSSPYQVYFNEPALSISGDNLTGPFDILAGHHNFITLLSACELSIKTSSDIRKIRINGGVMHVKANKVVVFLDI
jgi:F0F1-type ATP synthase epsilon subunit